MDINQKAKEFANYVKSTDEFRYMNKCKLYFEKNRTLKTQLNSYINQKNNIYSSYKIEDVTKKMNSLNKDYESFFRMTAVSDYMQATKDFNLMMEKLYKTIEKELLK